MKTNNKQVKQAIQNHILERVYNDNEKEFTTIQDACNHLFNDFNRVAGNAYNIKKIPNHVERFTDYLTKDPFSFEFTNFGVENFLNGLGINPENKEYTSQKMWALYGLLIYREMDKFKTI